MASLVDLAEQVALEGPALAHVQRLIASWSILADLCFADLLLFAPTREEDGNLVVLSQIRPTTSQTLYREDQVGRVVTPDDRPHVARAFGLGEIIHGEMRLSLRGELASIECIPVRHDDRLLGILTRESAPSVGRRPGELERVYVELFDRFARMIAAGEFPYPIVDANPDEVPRVGDGVARLDAAGRVDFASPNFVSALHRMGIHVNVQGARLGEVGMDDSAVRGAFKTGGPVTSEVERKDVTVLVRCLPLLDRGQVTGAVAMIRDVSDLRSLHRLLMSKDMTIREIHHRVKNNLQTISSLLRLQGRRVNSGEARAALVAAEGRIRSIALVHETLSATGATQRVDFDDIVQPLVRQVEEGLVAPDRRVAMRVEGFAGDLAAEVATPLSVVLTELLQNAVRHAYPDELRSAQADGFRGVVRVVMANDGNELSVQVIDDGVGLADEPPGEASLGLTIVRTLVAEMGGTLTLEGTATGTTAEVSVPLVRRRSSRLSPPQAGGPMTAPQAVGGPADGGGQPGTSEAGPGREATSRAGGQP